MRLENSNEISVAIGLLSELTARKDVEARFGLIITNSSGQSQDQIERKEREGQRTPGG